MYLGVRGVGRAGGYNQMLSSFDQGTYTLTGGRRFDAGKVGVIGSASGSQIHRGNQDVEVVYTPTPSTSTS